ncbi:DUF1569 domain-containing protein [Flagellimonas sp. HMM57]|uniref:DUF1569 domain-containing protein n=1 Tax=unclassified Flagellimonas TaxID=2644544 RepID=UPI0013D87BFF|nr:MULTISPECIES: DUF1569 domain-containing protein [unclassified Flagellimonas]UII74517.1 DUF1569 domain-containing protein [Flagellimonas sp. HMM57]
MFLGDELIELASYIKYRDSIDPNVSKVPVAWHVDHSLRTINEIYKAVKKSNPEEYRGSIHLGRSFLLLINKIPRGRAEAPKIVTPPDTILTDSLYIHLNEARFNLDAYDSVPEKAFFTHPYLGRLKKKTAKRFIEIHTEHHLKIIRDIIKG